MNTIQNPFAQPSEVSNITSDEIKYIGYGIFMPMLVLILAHSVVAVASVQLLVFLIQRTINKDRAIATMKLAAFTALVSVASFVIMVIS